MRRYERRGARAAIRFTISVDGHLLNAKATGVDDSLEEVRGYGKAMVDACRAAGCVPVLCDEIGLEYRPGTLDTFESAAFIAEYAPHAARVALVCEPDQLADASSWETVAGDHGLSARAFKQIDAAEEWLRERAGGEQPG
jgi:hypothetical protein